MTMKILKRHVRLSLVGLILWCCAGQAIAVDCLVEGATGTPLSKRYLTSEWNRDSGSSGYVGSLDNYVVQWREGEFLSDARIYCVGTNWKTSDLGGAGQKYPQVSINNFANYIKVAQNDNGADLRLTLRITDWSNNVILGSDWLGNGPGATCIVDKHSAGQNNCVIKFMPDNRSGEAVSYTRDTTYVTVAFSAELTPPANLPYNDPAASYYLVPAGGNLVDFVYYIPGGIGYINDIDSVPNGCGDADNGSNIEVPELPISMRRNSPFADEDDPDPGGEGTSCGGAVGSAIPPTTIHLPINLGGPGLAVNLSSCDVVNNNYTINMGKWFNKTGSRTGNVQAMPITLRCTGALNNVAVVFEDPYSTRTNVTPFTDGITLHATNGNGQLKNFKAEVVYKGSPVMIRATGDTDLTHAMSVGSQGNYYIGDINNAPVSNPVINDFTVRLHQTGHIVDSSDNAYYGDFEGTIKYIMIYN